MVSPHHRFVVSLVLTLSQLGCGQEGQSDLGCFPVAGTIYCNGNPVVDGMVFFHPLDGRGRNAPLPLAITDADGNFHLTTIEAEDGAPIGEYVITVELRELIADNGDEEEMVRAGKHLLPEEYRNPETSKLHYAVTDGENFVPLINLTRDGSE